jgi:hypothetical protein
VLHALSGVLLAVSAVCILLAVRGMIVGSPGPIAGMWLRAAAVLAFIGGVALNAASR